MKWLCSVGVAVSLAMQPALAENLFGNHPLTPEARDAFVTDLLKKMTVDEKIGQLRLISVGPDNPKEAIREMIKDGQVGAIFNTVTRQDIRQMQDQVMALSRLKIPLFFAYDVVHGQRTVFPISLGLASSFNLDAVRTVGRVSAYEAADDGLNMTWAPMVDVSRDPRWGRASEGFGEDTYLTSIMGETMVKAMQGKSPADRYSVMTSVKHFAAYGAVEGGKEYNTVDMSSQRLFNDYMPPYKAGLDAGSGAVMVALNSLNGTPATSDSCLLKDVLRDEWGFKGITVSDHGAIKELIKHGTAADPEDAVRVALKAGVDMSMADEYYSKYLPGLIKSGKVTMAELDDATRHVLNVKYDMGLFNDPYSHLGPKESDPVDTNAESRLHRKEAREVARESVVLLKNRLETLPLKKSGTIAVVGPLADSQRDVMGSWSAAGVANQSVTVLAGIQNAVGDGAKILYAKGANITNDKDIVDFLNLYEEAVKIDPRSPQAMIDEAVQAAKQADVVVAVVGESQGMAHEASSRTNITIPQSQRDLITALKATGKPLVLVLMNGRPLALVKEDQQADAILETWFAGMEGGNAIADVLFGDYNPSGKLPISFPRSVGQIPVYYSHLNTGRPYNPEKPNKYTSRYFDEANGPLYPFGYGLSYTTFTVSDVTLSSPTMQRDGKVTASVEVTNTGKREGATVIQMYLQDVTASMSRPVKQLKGFEKITLKPGERKTVSFPIDIEALKFWNQQMKYDAEPGKFNVFIGVDSARVKQGSFELL
ncbi:beta-glucosidase BglX [Salmonella enterica subsp. enterica serovar Chester]|uniref:beta-glucosidase BglX n=1 Tax=Salmonella enterica TaxID=28901 RepID=UPI000FA4B9C6|nr:beta-glucosidase BglX [Salmonella enterica]EDT5990591.1 beta-glucosidase BglX [Salmonella enterica subsp. enterica serovar Sandiego]EGZ4503910.1 beta-glucosidase BglX [Salmonella enterica subsp. enterica serovar Javiana]ECG6505152.1 beta-glucosidase BglX [Salmonella enterica subsp. enterica serovar Chester]EDT3819815.1 beta-glucosidase BglX [Salmonella enterica subsp. enterica serovar Chester]EDT5270038.1 beta-glucosidase BglX [Salmonella enterica subsp. enterica serovar Chester]